MRFSARELIEEFKAVTSGRTFDALLPPLAYVVFSSFFSLNTAILFSLGLAVILVINRLYRGEIWYYALGGLAAVAAASGMAYLTRSPVSYFIPALIRSGFLFLVTLVSLLVGKPLAAWTSHITRSWPLDWYWRSDIKPAYTEVTVVWLVFFALRLLLQIILFRGADAARLGAVNIILGWPALALVLALSYVYGIWRLRKLGGPGVDEFTAGEKPPWDGQKRGF